MAPQPIFFYETRIAPLSSVKPSSAKPSSDPSTTILLADHADDWVIRMDRGLSDEETKQFQAWLDQSQSNQEAYNAAASLWDTAGLAALSYSRASLDVAVSTNGYRPKPVHWIGGLACAFLMCILAWQTMAPLGMDIIATQQERAAHRLPDGSVAKLDFGSSAVIDYEEASRTLHLSGGAVYVDVKANKKRPFRVQLGDIIVEAVGTAYSVEELAGGEEVVVHEGIVSIRTTDNSAPALRLKAGQKWRRAGSDGAGTVTSGISGSRAYWNKGHIIARQTSLANILEKMSRPQGEDILWIDPDIQHIQISGLFQLSRSTSLSTLFLKRYNIEKYTLFGNQVIFYKKS